MREHLSRLLDVEAIVIFPVITIVISRIAADRHDAAFVLLLQIDAKAGRVISRPFRRFRYGADAHRPLHIVGQPSSHAH